MVSTNANVSDWVTETCTTIGTGDLILAGANLGFNKFKGAVPAGLIWYEVYEGNNKEFGIGTYDGDVTIARTTVISTLIGNIFDNSSPSPIILNGEALVASVFGAQAYEELRDHTLDVANPHNVTKTQVGLGNVDNTSDLDKPISNATQAALDLKTKWEEFWTLREFKYGYMIREGTSLYVANKTTFSQPPGADWDLMASDGVQDVNNIYDGFDSFATDQALSANKGRELYNMIQADLIVDGGAANSVYLPQQLFDGGNA